MNKKLASRLLALKTQAMTRGGSLTAEFNPYILDCALWRASIEGYSRVQRQAAFLKELVMISPITIPSDWELAGEHLPRALAKFGFLLRQDDPALLKDIGVPGAEIPNVKAAVEEWFGEWASGLYLIGAEACPPETLKGLMPDPYKPDPGIPRVPVSPEQPFGPVDVRGVFWGRGWIVQHSIRDYAKLIRLGFSGIRSEIECELEKLNPHQVEYAGRRNFLQAALLVCEAGTALGHRYAELAEHMATKAGTEKERTRLERMAQLCRKVPEHGATTFFEAVQSLWLGHILSCGEDGIVSNSFGRLDQILYPYYKADLEAGRLNREEAVEIMVEFACKHYLHYDVQAIVLGGCDKLGNDAVNEISYIILEATKRLGFIRAISVRLHENSPETFIAVCAGMILNGGGIPFIFNDSCFVKGLSERGVALEDARDYAALGCVEITIPGKANPHAVSGWINALKCLELALFGGRDPHTGEQVGLQLPALDSMSSFEEFYTAFFKQLEFFSRNMVFHCNRGEIAQREKGPQPCLSLLTDDCIKRGQDITNGGAVYNWQSVCLMGLANVADSLAALRKLVFEEKKVMPLKLLDALRSNFSQDETLRLQLLKTVPKYGNDIDEVDMLATRVTKDFAELMDDMESPSGGRYLVNLFSFRDNLRFGHCTGATPDGRLAGEAFAYSLSAHPGRDVKGITAMLRSLSKIPHCMGAAGTAAIIDISPQLFEDIDGNERMSMIIKSLIKIGVGQAQFNVFTAERLRLAQAEPEKYGNIPVRVAGYSQLFNFLDKPTQDHVIARTKHESC